jgi:hypothetical protein
MEVVTHHIHTRTLGWAACASRTAVNPSLGAAGKTSLFFTLRETHADQPLGPDCGALYGRARVRMTHYSHHTDAGRHEEVDPVMTVAPFTRANAIDTNRGHRAQITRRTTRHNRHGRAAGERDREAVFRIVKNRTFLPKAPGTDPRRSEKCPGITINRSPRVLFRSCVSS